MKKINLFIDYFEYKEISYLVSFSLRNKMEEISRFSCRKTILIYVRQDGLQPYKCGSEEGYTKEHVLNKCPVFESWRNRTRKKIGCNNIKLWLDKNIFKPSNRNMNDYKIKLIRSILNDFYKDKKSYMKKHKIRHAIIKYKKSKKGGKSNLFDA